jgi:hypothetical protein
MIYPWEIEVDVAEEVILQSPTLRQVMLGKAQELADKSANPACDDAKQPSRGDDGGPESA